MPTNGAGLQHEILRVLRITRVGEMGSCLARAEKLVAFSRFQGAQVIEAIAQRDALKFGHLFRELSSCWPMPSFLDSAKS